MFADVTSANVVGYQNKEVKDGFSANVSTFDEITGGGLDLTKFVPKTTDGEDLEEGEATIQFLDKYGVAQSSCSYYGVKKLSRFQEDPGWYDEEEEKVEDQFDVGQGLMIYANGDCVFPYSGEVNMAETDIPVKDGFQAFGNIRPCSVDIQKLLPVTEDGEEILEEGEITIQFLDKYGVAQSSCSYYGVKKLSRFQEDPGWYDEEEEYMEKEFEAGEGFMIYANGDGNIRFPEL